MKFEELSFTVPGMAQTKGSWKPGRNSRTGGVVLRPDNRAEPSWADAVGWTGRHALQKLETPIADDRRYHVELVFLLPKPPSRARTNRRDIDKLERSVLDALTGIVWLDDEQVDTLNTDKRPCSPAGPYATIWIAPLDSGF